jgi:hypothetical protein
MGKRRRLGELFTGPWSMRTSVSLGSAGQTALALRLSHARNMAFIGSHYSRNMAVVDFTKSDEAGWCLVSNLLAGTVTDTDEAHGWVSQTTIRLPGIVLREYAVHITHLTNRSLPASPHLRKEISSMKTVLYRLALPALLLATTPVIALASPLKVSPVGGDSHMMIMCPHCHQPIAGAKAGDYTIAFSADVRQIKTGSLQFYIDVTDQTGKPVTDAKVAIVLSMPAHEHARTVQTSGGRGGRYTVVTTVGTAMSGQWKADVKVTPANGETVSQAFTFSR